MVETGCQRLDFSGAVLALSSTGRDNEIWELCSFWVLERAGGRLLNVLVPRWWGCLWELSSACGWLPRVTRGQSTVGSCPTPGVSELGADVHPYLSPLPRSCPGGFACDRDENGMMAPLGWRGRASSSAVVSTQAACGALGGLSPRCPKGYPEANKTA